MTGIVKQLSQGGVVKIDAIHNGAIDGIHRGAVVGEPKYASKISRAFVEVPERVTRGHIRKHIKGTESDHRCVESAFSKRKITGRRAR